MDKVDEGRLESDLLRMAQDSVSCGVHLLEMTIEADDDEQVARVLEETVDLSGPDARDSSRPHLSYSLASPPDQPQQEPHHRQPHSEGPE